MGAKKGMAAASSGEPEAISSLGKPMECGNLDSRERGKFREKKGDLGKGAFRQSSGRQLRKKGCEGLGVPQRKRLPPNQVKKRGRRDSPLRKKRAGKKSRGTYNNKVVL